MFGSHFDHLLTSPGSISVHEQLHIAQRKSNNDHGIFLHISTERNTDKTFYQAIILHQALKQKKNTGSLIIVHVDGRCKLKMRAVFCDINRCKLNMKNAIFCLEYERL